MKPVQYWQDLPPWGKGVVAIVVVGGTAAIIYTIYHSLKKKQELKDANKAGQAAQDELSQLQKQGINPTFARSEFESMAADLVEAMNGCGTNEDMIYSVFKRLRNDADVRQLIATFGVRYYRPCAADQPISYTRWLFNDQAYGGDLPTWLSYDLEDSEIQKINSDLKTNKINYSF